MPLVSGRWPALVVAVAVLWGLSTGARAEACKVPTTGPFPVETVQSPSRQLAIGVETRIRHYSAFPLAPCALHGLLELRLSGLPAGRWGVLLTASRGLPFALPPGPVAVDQRGVAALAFDEGLRIYRDGIDGDLQLSLIDETGATTSPQVVRVRASGFLLWPGWIVLGLVFLMLFVAWRARSTRPGR